MPFDLMTQPVQKYCKKKGLRLANLISQGWTDLEAMDECEVGIGSLALWRHGHEEFKELWDSALEGRRESILERVYASDVRPLYDGSIADEILLMRASLADKRLAVIGKYLQMQYPEKHRSGGNEVTINLGVLVSEARARLKR